MRKGLLLVSLILATACASNQLDRFDRLKEGMDKDNVLEILGSPNRTEKSALEEKWAYKFYKGDDKEEEDLKYVKFVNGRVTAFGEDVEEKKRLQILKEISDKKAAERKQKAEVDEKVEKAMKEEKAKNIQEKKLGTDTED